MNSSVSGDTRRKLLAGYLARNLSAGVQAGASIPPRPSGIEVEASEAQQQLWLHSQMAGEAPLYNEPFTLHYRGELEVPAFERAFNEIFRRHEAWRTSFIWSNGKLVQVVSPEIHVDLSVTDLRRISKSKREATALACATIDSKAPFNLEKPPLFRGRLFRMEDAEYRLYFTLHHIIFDGVSLSRIFLPELQALYAVYSSGTSPALEPVSVHYPDYAQWHREWLLSGGANQQLRYWGTVFSEDAPEIRLPLDRPRNGVQSYVGAMITFAAPPETLDRLKRVAQECNATLNVIVLSAFHVLLYHYTGDCDQSIGTASSTRKHGGTMGMLGYFLNTVVLRTRFLPEDTFTGLVNRVREVTLNALSNNDVPFGRIVGQFDRARKPGVNPLFQVMFSLQPALPSLAPGWGFTQMDVDTGVSKFDLHLEIDEREEGLIGRFIYNTDLFDEKTIRQMTADWLSLLDAIAHSPHESISRLSEQVQLPVKKKTSGAASLRTRFQKLWS